MGRSVLRVPLRIRVMLFLLNSWNRLRSFRPSILHWLIFAVILWFSGLIALFRYLDTNAAIGMGQIWTEALGFTFAGVSLYLAWRGSQEPLLTVSFASDADIRLSMPKSDESGDLPYLSLYLRNDSRSPAHGLQVRMYTYPDYVLPAFEPRSADLGEWQPSQTGNDHLTWKPEISYLPGRASIYLGIIPFRKDLDLGVANFTGTSVDLLFEISAGNARPRLQVLKVLLQTSEEFLRELGIPPKPTGP